MDRQSDSLCVTLLGSKDVVTLHMVGIQLGVYVANVISGLLTTVTAVCC